MARTVNHTVTLIVALSLVACSSEQLKELTEKETFVATEAIEMQISANFCTIDANAIKSKLKFVFVLDKSGSNQTVPLMPGTDPDGSRRYNAVLNFLEQAPEDSSVSYALINFNENSWRPGNLRFQEKSNFKNLIIDQKFQGGCARNLLSTSPGCPSDGGWTSYNKGLENAYNLVNDDVLSAKNNTEEIVASYYVVFLLTDGAPIVGGTPDNYTYENETDILARVSSLKSIEFGENKDYVEALQVHTLFYYNTAVDTRATDLLASVANRGSGDFLQVSSGDVIDFTKFNVPIRKIKHSLREVFVENLNTVWWDNQLLADTDADLLPDSIEESLGSDPKLADSDGNGITDGVEYYASPENKPCKDLRCDPLLSEPYSACADLIKVGLSSGDKFGDLDGDGLNDCEEKIILKSLYKDWDSNKDWIPDRLALKFGLSFVLGSSEASLDPDADGISNYLEAKLNTPTRFSNDRVIGLKPFDYRLKLISSDSLKNCYQLSVPNVSSLNTSDKFRIYILENTAIIDDKRFLRSATRIADGTTVTFTKGDFQ